MSLPSRFLPARSGASGAGGACERGPGRSASLLCSWGQPAQAQTFSPTPPTPSPSPSASLLFSAAPALCVPCARAAAPEEKGLLRPARGKASSFLAAFSSPPSAQRGFRGAGSMGAPACFVPRVSPRRPGPCPAQRPRPAQAPPPACSFLPILTLFWSFLLFSGLSCSSLLVSSLLCSSLLFSALSALLCSFLLFPALLCLVCLSCALCGPPPGPRRAQAQSSKAQNAITKHGVEPCFSRSVEKKTVLENFKTAVCDALGFVMGFCWVEFAARARKWLLDRAFFDFLFGQRFLDHLFLKGPPLTCRGGGPYIVKFFGWLCSRTLDEACLQMFSQSLRSHFGK